jgi:hypothetical protein
MDEMAWRNEVAEESYRLADEAMLLLEKAGIDRRGKTPKQIMAIAKELKCTTRS